MSLMLSEYQHQRGDVVRLDEIQHPFLDVAELHGYRFYVIDVSEAPRTHDRQWNPTERLGQNYYDFELLAETEPGYGTVVGTLTLSPTTTLDIARVTDSRLLSDWRGKGAGRFMYKTVINYLVAQGIEVQSDFKYAQSPAAKGLWKSLARNPTVRVIRKGEADRVYRVNGRVYRRPVRAYRRSK